MQWVYRNSELASGDWQLVVDRSIPGWQHTGLRVGPASESHPLTLDAVPIERLILILDGDSATVEFTEPGAGDSKTQVLKGRKSVFHGTADCLYLPSGSAATITGSARVAVAEAPTEIAKQSRFIAAADVPVFVRGAGRESRQVHNLGSAEDLDAARFIVVEVVVPAGNWSGIPPHKHDVFIEGVESNLEEIYYFESAVARGLEAPAEADPQGFIKAYASDERPIDLNTEVRTGDVALIPHGWHGPVMAHPGYDLYFLNVMAGPDPDRSWNITEDPAHAWIRKSWHHQDADPRLPYPAN